MSDNLFMKLGPELPPKIYWRCPACFRVIYYQSYSGYQDSDYEHVVEMHEYFVHYIPRDVRFRGD